MTPARTPAFASIRSADTGHGAAAARCARLARHQWWLAVLLGACATGRPEAGVVAGAAEPDHHPVLSPSRVVDLGSGRPGISVESAATAVSASVPVARVPVGATVFFRNVDADHFVQLALSGDFESCAGCVTVTNFTCLKAGALAAAIEPGGFATLCFHKPGRYPLRVVGGERPLVGFLEVFDPTTARSVRGVRS